MKENENYTFQLILKTCFFIQSALTNSTARMAVHCFLSGTVQKLIILLDSDLLHTSFSAVSC